MDIWGGGKSTSYQWKVLRILIFFFLNFIFLGPHFKDKLLFVIELDKYIKNYKYLCYFNYYSKYVLINNISCKKSLAKKNFAGTAHEPLLNI